MWASSSSEAFAVGFNSNGGSNPTARIFRYDGATWGTMTPIGSYNRKFHGVWGTSGANVFAVGTRGTILHYGNEIFVSGFESGLDGWSATVP